MHPLYTLYYNVNKSLPFIRDLDMIIQLYLNRSIFGIIIQLFHNIGVNSSTYERVPTYGPRPTMEQNSDHVLIVVSQLFRNIGVNYSSITSFSLNMTNYDIIIILFTATVESEPLKMRS